MAICVCWRFDLQRDVDGNSRKCSLSEGSNVSFQIIKYVMQQNIRRTHYGAHINQTFMFVHYVFIPPVVCKGSGIL